MKALLLLSASLFFFISSEVGECSKENYPTADDKTDQEQVPGKVVPSDEIVVPSDEIVVLSDEIVVPAEEINIPNEERTSGESIETSSPVRTDMERMQEVADQVLTNLKQSKGILKHEKPTIIVRKFRGSEALAKVSVDSGRIDLDSRVYKICRNMGKDSLDALAFILAHELGHYIYKHRTVNHSIAKFEEATDRTSSLDQVVRESRMRILVDSIIMDHEDATNEARADFEGGFIGYLAGYQPKDPGIRLLRKVYDGSHNLIDLADTTRGYPTFGERIEIVEKTAKNLAPLKNLFEMANYLAALEQYEDAVGYYQKILKQFQSREIFNNVGVMCLLESMRCFKDQDSLTLFEFPIVLDVQTRISDGARGDGNLQSSYDPFFAINLVNKAIDYFSKSASYDENYPIAHLNLAVSHTLMALFQVHKDFKILDHKVSEQNLIKAEAACYTALHIIENVINTAMDNGVSGEEARNEFKKTRSDIHIQLGIIKHYQEKNTEAIAAFKNAIEINRSELACSNLNIITPCNDPVRPASETLDKQCVNSDGSMKLELVNIGGQRDQLFAFYRDIRKNQKWTAEDIIERGSDLADPEFRIFQRSANFVSKDFNLYYNKTNLKPKDEVVEVTIVLIPHDMNLKTQCGNIGIGSTADEVMNNYGTPTKIRQIGAGELYVYKPKKSGEARDDTSGSSILLEGSEERDGVIFHIELNNDTKKKVVTKWVPFYTYKGPPSPIMDATPSSS